MCTDTHIRAHTQTLTSLWLLHIQFSYSYKCCLLFVTQLMFPSLGLGLVLVSELKIMCRAELAFLHRAPLTLLRSRLQSDRQCFLILWRWKVSLNCIFATALLEIPAPLVDCNWINVLKYNFEVLSLCILNYFILNIELLTPLHLFEKCFFCVSRLKLNIIN